MRIVVTGAEGRVGRGVVELALAQGHTVVALDRRPIQSPPDAATYRQVDMERYDAVVDAFSGCDAVIHLAAISGPGRDPDHVVHDTNVLSSYHALRAAAELGIARVCQASSINAIGGRFSSWPRYDYFPLDEQHPSYAEDPYSLSKWICEQQGDAVARRYAGMAVASLRLHGVVPSRAATAHWLGTPEKIAEKQLWGYVDQRAVSRAFLLAVTSEFQGHEVFYIVAPDTMADVPSHDLAAEHYPDVPVLGDLAGRSGFFDCSKAETMLGWSHDDL